MEQKWWQNQIAYQIWPKSFCDSDGDGIGDIQGIISKLDYLKELGIGILWISPMYRSPLADEGYDISDYYDIDPRFGNLINFDILLLEARSRNIHVIMDLVVNHCSDEHEWFRKACEDPEGPYGKFFYIRDLKDGRPPTNWRSYFGGSVWEPLPGHPDKVYLHFFHKKQPDLNWENPELREEIYRMMNWWMDRGISGFRIDAIMNIRKPEIFRDYPADREDGLCSLHHVLHDQMDVKVYLNEMRDKVFLPHDAFTVGEVFDNDPEALEQFIGSNGCFSSMFDFSGEVFNRSGKGWYADPAFLTPDQYKECIFRAQRAVKDKGFLSNIIENHDEPRGVSRYLPQNFTDVHTPAAKKALAGIYFLLRGIPFIYQGQELGMENVPFTSMDDITDCSTLDQYRVALDAGLTPDEAFAGVTSLSRDNARTPFPWDDSENGGFTTGIPWAKPHPAYPEINAAAQLRDPDSVLSFYKKLTALRHDPEYGNVLCYGEFLPFLEEQTNLIAYYRWNGIRTVLVLANFQPECQNVELPEKNYHPILINEGSLHFYNRTLTLLGWQFCVLEVT
jgi:oligo-1,6-glucosidase